MRLLRLAERALFKGVSAIAQIFRVGQRRRRRVDQFPQTRDGAGVQLHFNFVRLQRAELDDRFDRSILTQLHRRSNRAFHRLDGDFVPVLLVAAPLRRQ